MDWTRETAERAPECVGVYLRTGGVYETEDNTVKVKKQAYRDWIEHRQGWKLVDFYSDPVPPTGKPVSRYGLKRLMADCRDGKITHIVTKSIGSFSTDAQEVAGIFRLLNSLPQPVGVYFECEQMDTLGQEEIFA